MPKITFIEPKAPNLHIFSMFKLPRLGSLILGTMMKDRGWQVDIIVEEKRDIDFEVLRDSELVAISTITSTAPRAYAIADRVRDDGGTVLMGGPHVTFLTDEALDHADFVIRGEGEQALMEFVDAWEGNMDFSQVSNLSYHSPYGTAHNPLACHVADLDAIPFADLSLIKNQMNRVAGKMIIPMQLSRGCPFDCSFCSVTGMFGKKYRYRSNESILDQLARYDSRKNFIFFYDDNFAANPKRTKELLRGMISRGFKFKWSTQVRVDIARDLDLVRLMKQAGCHTLFIGFESVNPDSLEEMKKKQTVHDMLKAVKVLRKQKINVHGMFVYGFDNDTVKSARETVKFAKQAKLMSAQFLILTPLPGSDFYKTLDDEKRILFKDWSLYDAHHAVFKPKNMTLSELQQLQIYSHRAFYSPLQTLFKFLHAKWEDVGLAHYARRLNILWQKRNLKFVKVIDLLTPNADADIKVEYKTIIRLDKKKTIFNT